MRTYAVSELTLDVLFPFVYATLVGLLIVKLWEKQTAKRLLWLPLVAVGADLLENATLAWQAFKRLATSLSWISSSMTCIKFLCLLLAIIAILIGAATQFKMKFVDPGLESPK